ncbi:MAG TPA: hypothetical protein PK076_12785 [Saprospiraceae bacterium]|nr:hypothetical protein [Saprospiraceae bacterium]
MRDLTPLEQQMRQLAADYSQTPPPGVWDNIVQGLEEENKKVWPMVLYIIGGTLLLAGIIYLISQTVNSPSSETNPLHIEYKTSGNDGTAADEEVINKEHMAQVEPNKNSSKEENLDKMQLPPADQEQREIVSALNKMPADNSKVNERIGVSTVKNSSKLSIKELKASPPPTNNLTDQSSGKQASGLITSNPEDDKKSGMSGSSAPAIALTSAEKLSVTTTHQPPLSQITESKELINSKYPSSEWTTTPGVQNIAEIKNESNNIKPESEAAFSAAEQSANKPDIKCPVFKNINKVQYFADAQFGIGYPVRHLSATSDNFAYLTRRESTEQPWFLWSGEVKAGVTLYEKFSISSGVNFTQLKESFHEERLGVIKITIVTFPDGQTDTTITSGTEIYKGEIIHSLLNIPLKVGYQHAIKRWIVGIEAGALWNISQRSRGWVLYPANTITRIENENIFKKRIGIGYTGGISVGTNVGRNMYAYLNPQITYFPTKWNVPEYKIDQNYIIPEVKVGIRFMFD